MKKNILVFFFLTQCSVCFDVFVMKFELDEPIQLSDQRLVTRPNDLG